MPRAETTKHHLGTQFYHSQFPTSSPQYLPDSASSSPQMSSTTQQSTQSNAAAAPPKKKHVCPTCERAFTTSGHLARHSRVHTGERNHKCPFPGCETRCSRQDNLQQHYRIHLSPGSRRSSTRSISRAMNGKRGGGPLLEATPAPPPLSSPPALEQARVYHHSPPPDSPPPLAQATLPATAHLAGEASGRSSSSPQSSSYSPINGHLAQGLGLSGAGSQGTYSYRSGTTTYQEQSQGAGFTYVHTTPISHSSTGSNVPSFSSYSSSHDNFSGHSLPHLNASSSSSSSPLLHQDSQSQPSSLSMPSRHSISHISHPQTSYSQPTPTQSSSTNPPSPASSNSVSSHTSGPPTPTTYPGFSDEAHTYQHGGNLISDQHISSQGQLVHSYNVHSSNIPRFESPPPVLAPIQDERLIRRADERHQGQASSHSSPYIHHPQPLPNDYPYHPASMNLSHGAWKSESGMRKGVNTIMQ
ncbi:hypothetical protein AX16_009414 [Volvariella volvacea WC 439]|nr:hypothetical protein AX16_009414 [Volvariella volvacea WC 439]